MRFALCTMLLAASVASAQQPSAQPTPGQGPAEIEASGTGEITVSPDRARIYLTVETRATTAAQAGTGNARIQRAVIDTLRRTGFGPDRVSTLQYAVSTDMRYGGEERGEELAGYIARNTVRVDVRDLSKISAIIDGALAAGANNVGGIEFSYSRERQARLQALDSAVAHARQQAMTIARASNGRLGRLVEMTTEHYDFDSVRRSMNMSVMAESMPSESPITPREITVTASVVGRWQFEPGPP